MKKILLPIHDPMDSASLDTGISLAQKLELPLEILHVHSKGDSALPLTELQELLKRSKAEGVDTELVISFGKPIKEIIRASGEISLVVLKHRTYVNTLGSGLLRLDDYSRNMESVSPVTKQVLKKVSLPCLVTFGVNSKMKRPLIAYNGSFTSKVAMRNALLLMAHKVFRRGVVVVVGKNDEKHKQMAREAVQLGKDFDIELESFVIDGEPSHEILEATVRFDCDLIVMGAYGRNWLEYAVFGSVLEALLSQSTIPVLLG